MKWGPRWPTRKVRAALGPANEGTWHGRTCCNGHRMVVAVAESPGARYRNCGLPGPLLSLGLSPADDCEAVVGTTKAKQSALAIFYAGLVPSLSAPSNPPQLPSNASADGRKAAVGTMKGKCPVSFLRWLGPGFLT